MSNYLSRGRYLPRPPWSSKSKAAEEKERRNILTRQADNLWTASAAPAAGSCQCWRCHTLNRPRPPQGGWGSRALWSRRPSRRSSDASSGTRHLRQRSSRRQPTNKPGGRFVDEIRNEYSDGTSPHTWVIIGYVTGDHATKEKFHLVRLLLESLLPLSEGIIFSFTLRLNRSFCQVCR